MCGSGDGSELTRRGGGDHEQRQKWVWGAKHLASPPSCTSACTAAAPSTYDVSIEGIGRGGYSSCCRPR
eukprot:scaffold47353_cov60-Phaeocystis_antarctica.AAC.2